MKKYLIVGLGNIGAEYQHTRHNIGFDIVDAWATEHQGTWRMARLAMVSECKLKGRTVICIKPTTYMNLSGRAMRYYMELEQIEVANTLTLVDDLALPLDRIRIRPSGSHAGHNGLKDIEAALGHNAFPKLRFGIGNHFSKGHQAEFVLSPWLPAELPVVKQKIDICVQVINSFVLEGVGVAMNRFNATKIEIPPA